jgi:hypothetical protein
MQICPVGAALMHVNNREMDEGTNSLIPFLVQESSFMAI